MPYARIESVPLRSYHPSIHRQFRQALTQAFAEQHQALATHAECLSQCLISSWQYLGQEHQANRNHLTDLVVHIFQIKYKSLQSSYLSDAPCQMIDSHMLSISLTLVWYAVFKCDFLVSHNPAMIIKVS